MSRYKKNWRIILSLMLAFHFTLVSPSNAQPIIHVQQMAFQKKMPFVMGWGVKYIAKFQSAKYGWDAKQFSCLNILWTQESHWNFKARNGASGAFGIPQALPADKMKIMGADWRTNPTTQIKWGILYIKLRYKTPCNALKHEFKVGYY